MYSSSLNILLNTLGSFPVLSYATGFVKDFIISIMKTAPVPRHVALIMDGNRTYAKNNNLPLKDGHNAGAESLIHVLDVCYRVGINTITIYAFSIENFNRSQAEVDTIFTLLRDKLSLLVQNETSFAQLNRVKIRIIGNKSLIPQDILTDLEQIETKSNLNDTIRVLNVCFPYTSRDEITHSMKTIVEMYKNHQIESKNDINMQTLHDAMYMGPDSPPLDLLIRTSGHTRLSDFMLWQCNQDCTIEFVKTLWPDFKFVGITCILFKWMYYKTLQLEEEERISKIPTKNNKVVTNILKELPPAPPFASVSGS
ncbi:dehydrodolichyl diphosphate synthase complex subunit Rer2p [[Candida] anglica]|uniref:Alkyl transferase n=1 Tax=[Candida] anglica TaxID=148631 RepID=A0ABP0ENT1_9ASCO